MDCCPIWQMFLNYLFLKPTKLDNNPSSMPEVVPPDLVDLLYHLLLALPQSIWHIIGIHDAFQPMLQTAVNLNEL
jgi:hypothetical protein